MSTLSISYMDGKTKLSMQFLTDIIKKMNNKHLITKRDLYNLSEQEIIQKMEDCKVDDIGVKFKEWKNTTTLHESDICVKNKYCKNIKTKIRYINPLINQNKKYVRIDQISEKSKQDINKCLNFKTKEYLYFDFNF